MPRSHIAHGVYPLLLPFYFHCRTCGRREVSTFGPCTPCAWIRWTLVNSSSFPAPLIAGWKIECSVSRSKALESSRGNVFQRHRNESTDSSFSFNPLAYDAPLQWRTITKIRLYKRKFFPRGRTIQILWAMGEVIAGKLVLVRKTGEEDLNDFFTSVHGDSVTKVSSILKVSELI